MKLKRVLQKRKILPTNMTFQSVAFLLHIIKNKDKILKQSSVSQQRQNHKKIRFCDYSDLDDVTMKWMTAIRQKNLPISGPLLQQKAKEFALALGHTDFAASNGWLHKFKKGTISWER